LLGFVAACILLLAFVDWNAMRGPVEHYLSAKMQREVRIAGDLDVHLFSWTPRAVANDLAISQPDWVKREQPKAPATFAEISSFAISVDLGRFLTGRLVLPEVIIDHPQFHFLRDATGRANWRRNPNAEEPLKLPPIRHFAIRQGRLDLLDIKRKLEFTGTVVSEETDVQTGTHTFELTGKGQLNRQPFSAIVKGDPLLNVEPDRPYGFEGDIRAGASRIIAKGSLNRPFDLGAFDVTATFTGNDLADLYYLTGLALPNTHPYRLAGELTRRRDDWRITGLSGKVGDSDLRGELKIDAANERPYLSGKVDSKHLDFSDLGPVIGSPPTAGSGKPASAKQQAEAQQLAATGRCFPIHRSKWSA